MEVVLRPGAGSGGGGPSTMRDYRSSIRTHLRPAFGTEPVESITTRDIEAWRSRKLKEGMTRRTATKQLMILHGVYGKPQGSGVDEGNLWGDYFYLEALARVIKPDLQPYW